MKRFGWLGIVAGGLVSFSSGLGWAQEAPTPTEAASPAIAPTTPVAAAPAATAPVATTAPPATEAGGFKLHLRATQPGVAFHYAKLERDEEVGANSWVRLCLEECELTLPAGSYRIALSSGAEAPLATPKKLELTRDTKLEGAYTDRSQRRTAGWLVLGLGGSISAANIALGAGLSVNRQEDLGNPTLIGGLIGLGVSLLVGIPLAAASDDAQVDLAR